MGSFIRSRNRSRRASLFRDGHDWLRSQLNGYTWITDVADAKKIVFRVLSLRYHCIRIVNVRCYR